MHNLQSSFKKLGHVKTDLPHIDFSKKLPNTPTRDSYRNLPKYMTSYGERNNAKFSNEKSLAEIASENWQFYDAPTTFR